MKIRFYVLASLLMLAFTVSAQRIAVLDFKANGGVSQQTVDGITAIFATYFQPEGYTIVERTQIDKVIGEQGFQHNGEAPLAPHMASVSNGTDSIQLFTEPQLSPNTEAALPAPPADSLTISNP